MEIAEYQPVAMKFTPWKVSGDPNTKGVNAEAFGSWYGLMVDVVMIQHRIPRNLLDGYSEQVWFGVTHKHTFLRPTCVAEMTFQMRPLKFQIDEASFHTKFCSWLGVVMEVRDGVYTYIFDGRLPHRLLGEAAEEAENRVSNLQLIPIIQQLNTKV